MSMTEEQQEKLARAQEILGYEFKQEQLLLSAITHPSATEGRPVKYSYERLEFLGDAVLQLCTSVRLYKQYPDLPEGKLSRLRARCVQESALEVAARRLHLGENLLLGIGEERGGGREKPSILADAMEALLGAMYLDGGMEDARRLIEAVVPIADAPRVHDYKTEYQELAQSVTGETPVYRIVGEEGPAHMRTFFAEVELCGAVTGRGEGSSKKHAEQQAARDALSRQGL